MIEPGYSATPSRSRLLGRYRGLLLVALGAIVGIAAGGVVTAMSRLTFEAHVLLFAIADNSRLSEQPVLASPWLAAVPIAGGLAMAALTALARRVGSRTVVDPIEANALYGGRMNLRDSLLLAVQTMVSSGFGASVGLEAGYTQVGSSFASRLAGAFRLRRNEVRMLVGCGAAGAISAAFAAPLTGAFYAFELIIGTYSVASVTPVITAALVAQATAVALGAAQTPVMVGTMPSVSGADLAPFFVLGLIGAALAIGVMLLVTAIERLFRRSHCPASLRPAIGGAVVGGLALVSPQILSSGHGALHLEVAADVGWRVLAGLIALKIAASAMSLGAGFRGGLFFSSLFVGSLAGKLFAIVVTTTGLFPTLSPLLAALVGMASMAVGVVGGPLTMSFLVLETTHDIHVTGAALVTALTSGFVVRETFGYSFSTWRLHLRGETIRSAHDIGWIRNLTVARLMRPDVRTVPIDLAADAFRAAFPLGSAQRVVAVDAAGDYAGIVVVAEVHAAADETPPPGSGIRSFARLPDTVLVPEMNAEEAARLFQTIEMEELAVVESTSRRRVVGLLTEQHLLRRYAEEMDKAHRDAAGRD